MASGNELRRRTPYALLVPGSGQGHINSCKLLARALAAKGFEVSFIYFSSEYAKLAAKRKSPTPEFGGGDGGSIRIHVLEDGFAPGDSGKPFFSTPAMQENLFNLILDFRKQNNPPTCLVVDPFAPWTRHVAERASIPLINYWTSTAMGYLLCHYAPHCYSQGIFPEKGPHTQWKRETPLMLDFFAGLPPFSSDQSYPPDMRFADASNPLVPLFNEISLCGSYGERMLVHALSELEADTFHSLQLVGISAYAVGPLLHYAEKQEDTRVSAAKAEESVRESVDPRIDCIQWLDTQAESSVIYIAFGSYASIPAKDIEELALGLEACGNPFLWVIRDDTCGDEGLPQLLDDSFPDRTRGKGMIIKWAPQVEVLAHKAIGGFLTHCGWNSTLESLWEGVPLLCYPISADQFSNSHYIRNVWGVGVELGRTDTGGMERRKVEVGVKGLMQEEEGLKARAKAQEVKEIARRTSQQGGQSFSNLQKLYEDMKELANLGSRE